MRKKFGVLPVVLCVVVSVVAAGRYKKREERLESRLLDLRAIKHRLKLKLPVVDSVVVVDASVVVVAGSVVAANIVNVHVEINEVK